jgi:peptidoglycan/xylan/chitin deacetylase (PgdA/CDA1 family)
MSKRRWACLIYHEIPAQGEHTEYYAVPRERFAAQLDILESFGLFVGSLEECLSAAPRKRVALTFDDGHRTHYLQAFPLIAARQLTATFFVTTAWVGTRDYVTWDELREMEAAGMSVQSHTVTHPFLSELDPASVERELVTSRAMIESELDRPCTTLALPNGDAPRRFRPAEYARIGYRCVASSRWGPNIGVPAPEPHGVQFIRRYTVRPGTPDGLFRRIATAQELAYGIEGTRQFALNTIRSMLGPSRYARYRTQLLKLLRR